MPVTHRPARHFRVADLFTSSGSIGRRFRPVVLFLAVAACALFGSLNAGSSAAAQPPVCPSGRASGTPASCPVTHVQPRVVANCPAPSPTVTNVNVEVENGSNLTSGQLVTFDACATPNSTDPTATITFITFQFGDGTTQTFAPTGPVAPGQPVGIQITHTYSSAGTYAVTVTAEDSDYPVSTPGIDTNSSIIVSGAGQALGVTLTTVGGADVSTGAPVTFKATATTPTPGAVIVGFNFDFGDTTSTVFVPASPPNAQTASATVTHTFASPGTYTVMVTASDSTGATGTASLTIGAVTAGQQPQVTLGPASTTIPVGQRVTFTVTATTPNTNASITSITVNCGNGTSQQVQNGTASCTYTAPGAYTVTATATDSANNQGTATAIVTVVPLPAAPPPLCPSGSASAQANPSSPGAAINAGGQQVPLNTGFANANGPYKRFGTQPIPFSAAGSQPAPGHAITAYLWNFGDSPEDVFVSTTSPTITHSYNASFTYTVTLVVVSECQQTQTVNGVTVGEFDASGNPVLDIQTISANTIAVVYPPLPNCYPPTGAGPFGPGQCGSVLVSCSASLTQACALPPGCGVSQAGGTCSQPSSCTGPISGSACVTPCGPQALSPTLQAQACPQPPATAASPVQLSIGGPYQGTVGKAIAFSATATGSVVSNVCTDGSNYGLPGLACTSLVQPAASASYLWDFGDGATATGQAVSHTYASPGTYTVNLTLSLGSPGLVTAQTTAVVAGSG
jgi:PKD repeat protein